MRVSYAVVFFVRCVFFSFAQFSFPIQIKYDLDNPRIMIDRLGKHLFWHSELQEVHFASGRPVDFGPENVTYLFH